jgi:surface antigen
MILHRPRRLSKYHVYAMRNVESAQFKGRVVQIYMYSVSTQIFRQYRPIY